MGRVDYNLQPGIYHPLTRKVSLNSADALAHAQTDDPLASARGVVWALIFGLVFWVGLYVIWRLVFR
jgi:hypothetical protein